MSLPSISITIGIFYCCRMTPKFVKSLFITLFAILVAGIGWTSWKKRWFILTQTSLVFFRSDPVSNRSRMGSYPSVCLWTIHGCFSHFCCFIILFFTCQSAVPQKGNEVNLTLGGIDLNNSGRLAYFSKTTCPMFLVVFL